MHYCPKTLLVEVGAQTNTVQEAKTPWFRSQTSWTKYFPNNWKHCPGCPVWQSAGYIICVCMERKRGAEWNFRENCLFINVSFWLLSLFIFIQQWTVRTICPFHDTHSLAFSSVRKCQNQHRLLQGKNQKENRVIFALLLCWSSGM